MRGSIALVKPSIAKNKRYNSARAEIGDSALTLKCGSQHSEDGVLRTCDRFHRQTVRVLQIK
jgi:hypothetical protein